MATAQRLSRGDLERVLRFVAELGTAEDVPALRELTMSGLGDLLDPDGVGYTEIDNTSSEAGFWTDPVDLANRANGDAFAHFLHQHPVAAFHERNGGEHAVQLADFLTPRQLHGLELYNDFYRPLEIEHQLAIALDAPGGIAIAISVHRSRREFSERERTLLELLHPHLEHAHRRIAARLASERLLLAMGRARDAEVIVLRDDTIEIATGSALSWLRSYFHQAATVGDRLPGEVLSWLDELRRPNPGDRIADAEVDRLVVARPGTRLSVRHLPARSPWEEELLLLEERRARPDPAELHQRGLTPREAEVLVCAADGRTDGEIAQELGISVRTVQRHLQACYRKLDVISRTAAVARALEPPTSD
jgi:DNA-binding CsgD family transcriptional regulator